MKLSTWTSKPCVNWVPIKWIFRLFLNKPFYSLNHTTNAYNNSNLDVNISWFSLRNFVCLKLIVYVFYSQINNSKINAYLLFTSMRFWSHKKTFPKNTWYFQGPLIYAVMRITLLNRWKNRKKLTFWIIHRLRSKMNFSISWKVNCLIFQCLFQQQKYLRIHAGIVNVIIFSAISFTLGCSLNHQHDTLMFNLIFLVNRLLDTLTLPQF